MIEKHSLPPIPSYYPTCENLDVRQTKYGDNSEASNRKKRRSEAQVSESKESEDRVKPKTPRRKKSLRTKSGVEEIGEVENKTPKPPRKRQPKPEPVYVIPDVERKTTTFRGRLGDVSRQ